MNAQDRDASGKLARALNQLYDNRMYDSLVEEYYSGSGYFNFGYWEEETKTAVEAAENLVEKLLDFLPDRQGTILDVACGTGATTRYLLKSFDADNVTGINISKKQLASCRVRVPQVRFLEMDAVQLQFPDCSFDHILCVEAAFHFNTREDFLREARRVLKPGRRLVLSDVLISGEFKDQRVHFCEDNMVESLDEYREQYERAGFSSVQIIDATEECWRRPYQHVEHFVNRKLSQGDITQHDKDNFLRQVYRLTMDLKYYTLVCAVR